MHLVTHKDEDKFSVFFYSVKELLIKVNLAENNDLQGMNLEDVFNFQKNNNIILPKSIVSYLTFFGFKINIRFDEEYFMTLKDIKTALVDAKTKKNISYHFK